MSTFLQDITYVLYVFICSFLNYRRIFLVWKLHQRSDKTRILSSSLLLVLLPFLNSPTIGAFANPPVPGLPQQKWGCLASSYLSLPHPLDPPGLVPVVSLSRHANSRFNARGEGGGRGSAVRYLLHATWSYIPPLSPTFSLFFHHRAGEQSFISSKMVWYRYSKGETWEMVKTVSVG